MIGLARGGIVGTRAVVEQLVDSGIAVAGVVLRQLAVVEDISVAVGVGCGRSRPSR